MTDIRLITIPFILIFYSDKTKHLMYDSMSVEEAIKGLENLNPEAELKFHNEFHIASNKFLIHAYG